MIFVYFCRRSRIFVSKKGIYILVNTIPCILIRSRKLIRAEFVDIVLFSTGHLHLPWQAQCWRAPDVVSVVVLIICRSFSRCSINSYIVSLKNIFPPHARMFLSRDDPSSRLGVAWRDSCLCCRQYKNNPSCFSCRPPLPLTFHYPAYLFAHLFVQSLIQQRISLTKKLIMKILTATLKLQPITPDIHFRIHTMNWTRDLHQLFLYCRKFHS